MSDTGSVGVTSMAPVRCDSQPTQILHTLTSSWHINEATIDGSRSSPQQKHSISLA
jgi:hypothetical protein